MLRQYSCAAATPLPGVTFIPTSRMAISAPPIARQQHELVEVAEVADAEEPAGHPGEPGAQREVVAAVGDIDHLGTVDVRPAP